MLYIRNKNDTILYKYDNQGNTLKQKSSKGVISYTYDIYNRTRQVVTENGSVIKNKYDPLGFRYQKEVNGEVHKYIFDGWSIVAETNKEGELKSREVRGYSLVKKEKEETTYYYHQNEHGDITHLTNNHEEIENSYSYDVFGNIREEKEAVFNYFKYSGEQYEKEIEQYYLRARFYNPVIGRFTQEDVYRGDGLNLYVYVVNNPLLWVDPSGYAKCSSGNTNKIPNRNTPHIEDGNLKEGWIHIDARHVTGNHPSGHGDLFAPGTTRRQLEQAAKNIVSKGRRITVNPNGRMQTFEKDIVVNKRKDLVRVIVDSYDSNRVITIFPVRSEN